MVRISKQVSGQYIIGGPKQKTTALRFIVREPGRQRMGAFGLQNMAAPTAECTKLSLRRQVMNSVSEVDNNSLYLVLDLIL